MVDTNKLLKYAINYLSKYSSSKANLEIILKNKIRRLKIDNKEKFLLYNSIEEIIDKLEKNKYIDDDNYTFSKIRSFIFQGKSRIFIKSYLLQKRVGANIISKTFDLFDTENSNWELESAKKYVRKKRFLEKPEDKERSLAKMARAGFNYEIATKAFNEI
jgi:SOS response regulatory protein OraA/RecX